MKALTSSTVPTKLLARFHAGREHNPLTVVFSTYQTIDVVYEAQQDGFPEFDLVVR